LVGNLGTSLLFSCTTKQGFGVVVVVRSIAWKSTNASMEEIVVGVGGVLGDVLVVLLCRVLLLPEERQ